MITSRHCDRPGGPSGARSDLGSRRSRVWAALTASRFIFVKIDGISSIAMCELLRQTTQCKLNLEMSIVAEIVDIAMRVAPDQATLVPERRQEVTTEGGLDLSQAIRKPSV